jgi:hypothetical protein
VFARPPDRVLASFGGLSAVGLASFPLLMLGGGLVFQPLFSLHETFQPVRSRSLCGQRITATVAKQPVFGSVGLLALVIISSTSAAMCS